MMRGGLFTRPGPTAAAVLAALVYIAAPLTAATPVEADRITVSGTQFLAGTNRIWINGANTPWHVWNEFGGKFDAAWWDRHFQQLRENGINATRVWISCNGDNGIDVDASGHVLGCTPVFWTNLDTLFQLARQRRVYIDATLLSFDHFSKTHRHYERWRKMLGDDAAIDSLVAHYVVPLVVRYRDNPWLWSVDLCNEPDWIHENENCGRFPWAPIQRYVAKAAYAIHAQSPVLVTIGICMGVKYMGNPPRTNLFSDAVLRSLADGDPGARLDFYSPHYYDWEKRLGGNPFYQTPAAYRMDAGKPVVIGESPAKGTGGHSVTEDYEGAFENGWQGVMAWSSNGVDNNGGLRELGPATRALLELHPQCIFPGGASEPPHPAPRTP